MKLNAHIKAASVWKAPERDMSSLLLDLNENQFLRNLLADFVANKLEAKDLLTYPNYQQLLLALEEYCKVPADSILITNGADQAIDLAIRLLFSPGDRVVIPSPVFSFYYQMLGVNGVEAVAVGYQRSADHFVLPVRTILRELENSHGLILCNPNNPLGVLVAPSDLRSLIESCVRLNKPIIVDECYFEYLQHSCVDDFKHVKQLFVIRSFSKYFGLAGLRLGYVITSPASVREMRKVRGPWDVNHAAVKAGLYCLENLVSMEMAHRRMNDVKREIIEFCRAHEIVVINTHANFLLIEEQREGALAAAFREANIRVSDCSAYLHSFGLLEGILRVAVPAQSDLKPFLLAISNGVAQKGCLSGVKITER